MRRLKHLLNRPRPRGLVARPVTAAPELAGRAADSARELGKLNKLWDSWQAGTRDTMDVAAKFTIPLLVENGRVFVTGQTQLTVYGLLP